MDRVLILIVMLIAVFVWLSKNSMRLSYPKFMEMLVTMFVFSCCFTRLSIPLFTMPYEHQYGPFGQAFRLEMSHVFILILLWVISQKQNFKFPPIKPIPIIAILFYVLFTILNPFNTIKASSFIALNYFLSYMLFLYLLTSCCSINTIIKGLYNGLCITLALHLAIMVFYSLGLTSIVVLFNSDAVTRRGACPGTFGHPNVLAAYASFYMIFFFACALMKYKSRASILCVLLSFVVIYMSGSRSSLLGCAFAFVVLVVMYVYRRYSLFNVKILLKGVLPITILLLVLFKFTPIGNMFGASSDADDMVLARYMHYYCAYEIFSDHPLVGVGLNSHLKYLVDNSALVDIETVFQEADSDIWLPEEFMFANPIHNIWMILLTEFGIIGVLPILSFLIYYFVTFKKKIMNSVSDNYRIIVIAGLGVLSYMFVHGNTDWALYTPTLLNISLLFLFLAETSRYSQEITDKMECFNDK